MIHDVVLATVGPILPDAAVPGGGAVWPLFVALAFPLGTIFGLWLVHRDAAVPPGDGGGGGGGPGRSPQDRPGPADGDGEDPPAWIEEVENFLAREAEEHPDRRG
jgi:hypothetical protein